MGGVLSRAVLGLTVFVSTALGSLGFRSDNWIVGFLCVLIAIIGLIYLSRFLWDLIGFVMSIVLVFAVLFGILYLTGAFSGDTGVIPEKAVSWMKREKADKGAEEKVEKIIYGPAQVISGDTFSIMGKMLSLYGIAAPQMDQVCSSEMNQPYKCGQAAADFLATLLQGQEPVCTVIEGAPSQKDVLPVICNVGKYDLGALVVVEGWAIPAVIGGTAYIPYETKARELGHGLWKGSFLAPWEWDAQQRDQKRRQGTIKVPEPPRKKGKIYIKDYWLE